VEEATRSPLMYQFDHKKLYVYSYQIFIPNLALAFEYNGEYHYKFVPIHPDFTVTKQRDQFKQEICQKNGITLIVIPYWWDKSIESLAQTIRLLRPDIPLPEYLLQKNHPILMIDPSLPERFDKGIYIPKAIDYARSVEILNVT